MSREVDYQFAADSTSAERLDRMSEIFAPTMGSLVESLPDRDWGTVLDLGCGSGSSTRCLQGLVHAGRIVGVDASEEHLARARRMSVARAEFVCGDVVAMDLAGYDADLIYVRFLLAYLEDVSNALDRWLGQLATGGVLAIEESLGNESVEPAFQEYFDLVDCVAKKEGTCFFGARKLHDLAGHEVLLARDYRHAVPGETAAEMFLGNLPLWEAKPWIRDAWGERLPALRVGLEEARSRAAPSPVVWTLRQVLMAAVSRG